MVAESKGTVPNVISSLYVFCVYNKKAALQMQSGLLENH
jgi:hypothetical protein